MNAAYRYVMLLTSLPRHPEHLFSAKRPPVSRIQLDKRLAQLTPEHQRQLQCVEQLAHWRMIENLDDDSLLSQETRLLAELTDASVREMVRWRLNLRSLVAALRMKRQGLAISNDDKAVLGEQAWIMARNWQTDDLGLGYHYPWLSQAWQHLQARQSHDVEKLLLSEVWNYYTRLGQYHAFDFPAVVIYVLKWDVLHRFVQHDAATAWSRFRQLIDSQSTSLRSELIE